MVTPLLYTNGGRAGPYFNAPYGRNRVVNWQPPSSVVVEVTVTVSKEDGISENVARSMRNNSSPLLGIDLEDDLTD